MEFKIESLNPEDRKSVIDIFNYYVENSFAAYREEKVGYEFYDMIMSRTKGYPAVALKNSDGELVGYGVLRPYHFQPAFLRTAEISYFIRPEFTGRRLGNRLLDYLIVEAKKINIDNILASISSLNDYSIKFHRKNGFKECGRFQNIGRKKGIDFDIVWMQRQI
ncbi:MAG: N-acetyltransferase family protein [Chloroflexota bacterium]